jgi:hypothetical protein
MAVALRSAVRRLATSALRAATAEATNVSSGRISETVNAYGVGVSKAQGVVDGLTGGKCHFCKDTFNFAT